MVSREKAQEWLQSLEDPGPAFALGAEIGSGNAAVVHEATTNEGKTVAIKIMEETDNQIEAIYEEHLIMSEVCDGNPHFPLYHGAYRNSGTIPQQIWFVMEICEEGTIKSLLMKLKQQERFLKEDIIAYVLREVLQGIKDLHEKNIIHRDIKAANILVTKDGTIKLGDFGFAKNAEPTSGKLRTTVGSPYWMSPEVVAVERGGNSNLEYDSRADVWSLGITAAELGDCEPPNVDVFAPRVLFQILQNPPPTLRRPQDWTQLYNDFIAECLEKNPDHRPWSAELMEHTFITEIAERENQARKSLIYLINELRKAEPAESAAEISVRGDMIQMDRRSAPQPMYRDDLATLDSISDEAVMETLNQRFAQGNIYTYLGDILIAINPFREYPIYGAEFASRYKYRARCDNAPHIYAVADRAYQDMLHHKEVQNIILTGETGSGKTSSGQHLLWHLANMTASNKKMVERTLKVSTVMEAFGNAATVFNSNSTRHIQYLELTFTKTGKLSGGILWAYCLEKWRVTSCARSQSNFHIFYYVMETLISTDQAKRYHLEKGRNYNYLPPSPAHTPAVSTDKLREVKEAFHILDFALEDQETIVKMLSAILLIGEIKFSSEDGDKASPASVQNMNIVENVAELLNVDVKKLAWTFTNYCVISGGETIHGKSNQSDAEEVRDSLARSLYCRLVDWIVNLINTKLSFTRLVLGDHHSLGILDIPGYEVFAHDNTLDQFLVNMTNEQMQFFYNQRVFMWEMQDYEKEEISGMSYNYHDNRELLDAVLSKPGGLLAFLDDETKSAGNDHTNFMEQIEKNMQTRFIRATDASSFTVSHYSGQVIYDARNFVERNKNFLSPEMIQVMRLSENPTVVQLFSNLMTKTGNLTITEEDMQRKQTKWTSALAVKPLQTKKFNTKSRGKYSQSRQMQTIAATMRNSLLEMLQKVSEGSAHFVRCLRSNLKSTPFSFDRDLIRYQIRALGIVESIRIRQAGYPRRLKFAEFLRRYKFLAFDFDENVEETMDNCRLLLIRLKLEGWALGKNRVLLKHYNEEYLSRLYEQQVNKVVKIQSMMRAFLARKKMSKKFPRLAELRQGSIAAPDLDVKLVKKNLLAPKGKAKIPPVSVSPPKIREHRTSERAKSPPVHYAKHPGSGGRVSEKAAHSKMQTSASYSGVVNLGKASGKKGPYDRSPRRSLIDDDDDDEGGYERPPSPRDIAAKFEKISKEQGSPYAVGARYRPSSAGSDYSSNPGSSRKPGSYQRVYGVSPYASSPASNYLQNSPGFNRSGYSKPGSMQNINAPEKQKATSTPEIINPMEEFTNMASKMMPDFDPDFDDYGPFDFKSMLKKTGNLNFSRSNPSSPSSTSGERPSVYVSSNGKDLNRNPRNAPKKNSSAPSTPMGEQYPGYVYSQQGPSKSANFYGGERLSPSSSRQYSSPAVGKPNAYQRGGGKKGASDVSASSTMTLAPGIVLEGEAEEL